MRHKHEPFYDEDTQALALLRIEVAEEICKMGRNLQLPEITGDVAADVAAITEFRAAFWN